MQIASHAHIRSIIGLAKSWPNGLHVLALSRLISESVWLCTHQTISNVEIISITATISASDSRPHRLLPFMCASEFKVHISHGNIGEQECLHLVSGLSHHSIYHAQYIYMDLYKGLAIDMHHCIKTGSISILNLSWKNDASDHALQRSWRSTQLNLYECAVSLLRPVLLALPQC